MMRERWEDMPAVVEAAASKAFPDYGYSGDRNRMLMGHQRAALAAAVAVEPVVPVRVLRDWIGQERQHASERANYSTPAARVASKWAFDALARRLDDYEKENPNA